MGHTTDVEAWNKHSRGMETLHGISVYTGDMTPAELQAVRLWRAAPELLAALQGLRDEILALVEDGTLLRVDVLQHPAFVKTQAAIHAATGGTR